MAHTTTTKNASTPFHARSPPTLMRVRSAPGGRRVLWGFPSRAHAPRRAELDVVVAHVVGVLPHAPRQEDSLEPNGVMVA